MIVLCSIGTEETPWGQATCPALPPGTHYVVRSCDRLEDFCVVEVTDNFSAVKADPTCFVLHEGGSEKDSPTGLVYRTRLNNFLSGRGMVPAEVVGMGVGTPKDAVERAIKFLKDRYDANTIQPDKANLQGDAKGGQGGR